MVEVLDDEQGALEAERYDVPLAPEDVLITARQYLDGVSRVYPRIAGKWSRFEASDHVLIHHGRMETKLVVEGLEGPAPASSVRLMRQGRIPLEDTRNWLTALVVGGFAVAWAISFLGTRGEEVIPPLALASLFLISMAGVLGIVYVIDRSLERQATRLIQGVRDAFTQGWWQSLRQRSKTFDVSNTIANTVLVYASSLILLAILFVILLSDGIREGINEVVTFQVMRGIFGIPVLPSILFGVVYYLATTRIHQEVLLELRDIPE